MGGNEPEVESNGYAPKARTSQIDECQRCGRKQGLVGKYDIYLCRQCFREIARDIGFRKYGGSSSSRSDDASTSFVPSAGSDPEADQRDSDEETDDKDEETDDKADLDLADSEVEITLDETDVEAQFEELASDLELSDREQEAVEQAIRDYVNDVIDENYADVGPEMRNAIANVVAATLKQEFQQLENDG